MHHIHNKYKYIFYSNPTLYITSQVIKYNIDVNNTIIFSIDSITSHNIKSIILSVIIQDR